MRISKRGHRIRHDDTSCRWMSAHNDSCLKWTHLYIRYRSRSGKWKQRSSESLQTAEHCYSNAKSTLLVPLFFSTVEQTKHEKFNFVHLLCFFLSFFLYRINSESIWFLQTINIPNDCFANLLRSYLVWALCELRVASYGLKTISETLHILVRTLLGFSDNNCVSMASIVRSHLEY